MCLSSCCRREAGLVHMVMAGFLGRQYTKFLRPRLRTGTLSLYLHSIDRTSHKVSSDSLDGETNMASCQWESRSHTAKDMNRGEGRKLAPFFEVSWQYIPCIMSPREGRNLPCSKGGCFGQPLCCYSAIWKDLPCLLISTVTFERGCCGGFTF